jgi:hypothetical protein
MAVPSVIIGLGGFGCQVVAELKTQLIKSNFGRLPEEVRLLVVDTVPDRGTAAHVLSGGEYCSLNADLYPFINEVAEGQHPEVASWFATAHYFKTLPRAGLEMQEGAIRSRQLARLAFFREITKKSRSPVYLQIREAIRSCLQAGDPELLQVLMVTSLAGGTGSGILLDIAYLVRAIAAEEFGRLGISLQGYIVFPHAFLGTVPGLSTTPLTHARVFAVLRELSRFQVRLDGEDGYPMYYHDGEPEPILRGRLRVRPFDWLYFVDGGEDARSLAYVPIESGVTQVVADALLFTLDARAGRSLASHRVNLVGHLSRR